jgi:hypothetical protein
MAVKERGTYNVIHKGCHNYSSVNKQNHNVQSCKQEGSAILVCLYEAICLLCPKLRVYAAQLLLVQLGITNLPTPTTTLPHLTLCGLHLFNG